jgi:Sec-independent protein translocase protein TatA
MMNVMLFIIGTEWIVVLVVAAIILPFGGSKLPQFAKAWARARKHSKKGISEGERIDSKVWNRLTMRRCLKKPAGAQQMRADDAKKIDR